VSNLMTLNNSYAVDNLKIPVPVNVKNDINAIATSLIDRFSDNIEKIILFGSFCDDSYQADSDIDIAVILRQFPDLKERRLYYEQVVDTEREVDLLFCTDEQLESGKYVYRHIKSKGVVVYEQL
jgi:Nucleotidyltransferase domain.